MLYFHVFSANNRASSGFSGKLTGILLSIRLILWDICLTIRNIFSRKHEVGNVIHTGLIGHGGVWPRYVPPSQLDSRSCCPMLNALANHGIITHDGRDIPFAVLNDIVCKVYNVSPTWCYYITHYAASMLSRSYESESFDLNELSLHNGIEHDASLTRYDTNLQHRQSKPTLDLIDELLTSASLEDPPRLSKNDLSLMLAIRRDDSKSTNGQYTQSFFHKTFGSMFASLTLRIFGGLVRDLEIMLKEERIPEGWEPKFRKPNGLTLTSFNMTILAVEYGAWRRKSKIGLNAEENGPQRRYDRERAESV